MNDLKNMCPVFKAIYYVLMSDEQFHMAICAHVFCVLMFFVYYL